MTMTREQATAILECYGNDRWGRAYGFKDAVYAGGWHRGQDIRKQVPSGAYSVSHDAVAICAGTIVYVGRPNQKISLTVVIDTRRKDGRYEFHSHQTGAVVKVGQKVNAGQKLARTALAHENPGSSWGGPHDHVVFSNHSDGAWNTVRAVIDPRPIIREQLAAAKATLAPKPIPAITPTAHEEDDMNVTYHKPKKSTKVYALYADGTARHVGKVEWALVRASYKVTGRKLPYTIGAVTEAQIATLPKHGK